MAQRFEGQSQSDHKQDRGKKPQRTLFTLARPHLAEVHLNLQPPEKATFPPATPTGNTQPGGIPLAG